ncbi:hypothetical protein [Blautia sp. HCP28S3_G10]|uniref:hypothetical protein n=1 Tax=Blautia sp. HCP28S3_G10 TaxID=3438908 RepID=UPI003F8898CF
MKETSELTGRASNTPEAKIAICKCKESKKLYGVRFEKDGDGWKYTWAFPIKEDVARREGYDTTTMVGMIHPDEEYPGCPYCGRRTFVVCGDCHKLSCNIVVGNTFTCDWCGMTGTISDYEGEGISSGGDLG